VGGIKEKLLAAKRAGVTTVILPKLNEKDLKELPETVRNGVKFRLVETMDEVLQIAMNPPPVVARESRLLQRNHGRSTHRTAERHEPLAAQHEVADMSVLAVLGILEAEAAFEPEPTILPASQADAAGMHGVVQPLHGGGATGIPTDPVGAFGGGACGAPIGKAQGAQDHQQEEARHARNVPARRAPGKLDLSRPSRPHFQPRLANCRAGAS